MLVERASEIDWTRFEGIARLGVTAGASAPETLVDEIEAWGISVASIDDVVSPEHGFVITRVVSVASSDMPAVSAARPRI